MGRPAGRARGRLRVRPAGDGRAVRGRLAVRQPEAGHAAGVRLGGQPVHALRAQHEHQRRAGGGAAGLVHRRPVGAVAAGRADGGGWTRQARSAGAAAAADVAAGAGADAGRVRGGLAAAAVDAGAAERRPAPVLGAHVPLPAEPGDATLDLDAGRVSPGLADPALAAAGAAGCGGARLSAAGGAAAGTQGRGCRGGAGRSRADRDPGGLQLLVLPLHLLVAAAGAVRDAGAAAGTVAATAQPALNRNVSIEEARPLAGSHSISAPSMRTSFSAGSNRTGSPVWNRRSTSSVRTPITESWGPVMPPSVR